jgi:hypothetical protein
MVQILHGRALAVLAVVVVVSSASGVAYATSGTSTTERPRVLHLLDVGPTIDTFLDNGVTGPSAGDVEIFRDTLVWAKDHSPAGYAEGHCTLVDAAAAETTCTIVTKLGRSTVTTEGIGTFVPGSTSTAGITGGTGDYDGASGHASFVYSPGQDSAVVFTLER